MSSGVHAAQGALALGAAAVHRLAQVTESAIAALRYTLAVEILLRAGEQGSVLRVGGIGIAEIAAEIRKFMTS